MAAPQDELFYENAEIEDGVLLDYWGKENHVVIPEGITTVAEDVFEGHTEICSVTLPDSLRTFEAGAFIGCFYLEEFILSETNPHFTCDNTGALLSKDGTILVRVLPTFEGHYNVPDTVITIGKQAFDDCDVTSVAIPGNVRVIGESAFECCTNLTTVTMADGVTAIDESAFNTCSELTSVTIPDSVTAIGVCAFAGCDKLTSVDLPGSITVISRALFSGCDALTSVAIPKGVTTIDNYAFNHCKSLTSVTIADSVTTIGEGAFHCCESLQAITIPASVTAIGVWEDHERKKPAICAVPGSFAWQWAQQNKFPVKKLSVKQKTGVCPHCGGKLKGLFFKKCPTCGKPKPKDT